MPKISSKRQITLPVEQCDALGFVPGDDVEILAANGVMTIVKKKAGAARGLLQNVKGKKGITDEESLRSSLR